MEVSHSKILLQLIGFTNPSSIAFNVKIISACLRVMHGHESRIMSVKIYPKSRRILSGDEGGHILVWNASRDKKKKSKL